MPRRVPSNQITEAQRRQVEVLAGVLIQEGGCLWTLTEELKAQAIVGMLNRCQGNIAKAARRLNLPRTTFKYYMKDTTQVDVQ